MVLCYCAGITKDLDADRRPLLSAPNPQLASPDPSPVQQRTRASTGDEAFTDAAADDGGDSKLSALLSDVSQQVQCGLQSMLKMSSEIALCDGEIGVEVERARDAVVEKGRALHDERERVQKAALAALDILSGGRGAI
ncbi:uncharacterized protein [Miscanthus floridulus]|uniref:uncharacterized protein n=1 Tax=Miscanthus floridulus TaxID=154761 RepID=UPI003457CA9B